MRNIPTSLSNLKSKVDKLDVDKLVYVPIDLSKLSDVVKLVSLKKMFIMLRSKILYQLKNTLNLLVALLTLIRGNLMECQIKFLKI